MRRPRTGARSKEGGVKWLRAGIGSDKPKREPDLWYPSDLNIWSRTRRDEFLETIPIPAPYIIASASSLFFLFLVLKLSCLYDMGFEIVYVTVWQSGPPETICTCYVWGRYQFTQRNLSTKWRCATVTLIYYCVLWVADTQKENCAATCICFSWSFNSPRHTHYLLSPPPPNKHGDLLAPTALHEHPNYMGRVTQPLGFSFYTEYTCYLAWLLFQ